MIENFIYYIIVFGLIALSVISFTLFIRKLLVNSTAKIYELKEIGKKLEEIIEILKSDNK